MGLNKTNLDIIRSTYDGPSAENGKHLLAALAPDAEWVEAAGFPYAGTYVGPEAIIANVFQPSDSTAMATLSEIV